MFKALSQLHMRSYILTISYKFCACSLVLLLFYSLTTPVYKIMIRNANQPWKRFSLREKYITSVFSAKSRLGNHIFELASLLGISKTTGRTPIFYLQDLSYISMLEDTNKTMPGLIDQFIIKYEKFPIHQEPTTFNTRCCIYQDPDVLNNIYDDLIVLGGHFYQSYKYFPGMREAMRNYLRDTDNEFRKLPKSTDENFINCVHVRRSDFARFGFHSSDMLFVNKAMAYIENKMTNEAKELHTVIFGDDFQFMTQLAENVPDSSSTPKRKTLNHISQNSPLDDLIYAKHHCDSVFITAPHSTFGWWMGYLSKGDNVYYTDIRATNDSRYLQGHINPVDYYLPHWTPLRYDNQFDLNVIESRK